MAAAALPRQRGRDGALAPPPGNIPLDEYSRYGIVWMWDVEYTDEFGAWWNTLPEGAQESIATTSRFCGQSGRGWGGRRSTR